MTHSTKNNEFSRFAFLTLTFPSARRFRSSSDLSKRHRRVLCRGEVKLCVQKRGALQSDDHYDDSAADSAAAAAGAGGANAGRSPSSPWSETASYEVLCCRFHKLF